jgi:hypothetical protein
MWKLEFRIDLSPASGGEWLVEIMIYEIGMALQHSRLVLMLTMDSRCIAPCQYDANSSEINVSRTPLFP